MNIAKSENLNYKELETKKEKRDIRIVFLIFSAIFWVLAWRHYPSILSNVFMGVVLVILPLAAIAPTLLRPLFKLWMKLAHAVGWFNTQVLFTKIVYIDVLELGIRAELIEILITSKPRSGRN